MTILEKIVARKRNEVEERKKLCPVAVLEKSANFHRKPLSLKASILCEGSTGIIAEFKRRSPSAGIINETAHPEEVCRQYMDAGSSAVSVLTDHDFFGGSSDDLLNARQHVTSPVLRKDFIIDEYQIVEARSIGADAVLLIAELHIAPRLVQLHDFAVSLGLEVLLEIHDEKSIPGIPYNAEIIGINSRNLATFSVNHDHPEKIIRLLPEKVVKVAESGIRSVSDYLSLKNAGFDAFLIGECFMKAEDPGGACKAFIDEIRLKAESKTVITM